MSPTGFYPTLKVWFQMPPGAVSEVENFKFFLGEHPPRPSSLGKLMSTMISLADQKSCIKHSKHYYTCIVFTPPLTQQLSRLPP